MKPLLSICIPTYNRSSYLKKSLDSLLRQQECISGEVEILISDNASTDDTEEVIRPYLEKHGNILYFRNEENVHDRNFPLCLSRAHGIYRKLCNDTLIYTEHSLHDFLAVIRRYQDDRPFLYFLNRKIHPEDPDGDVIFDSLDAFMESINYLTTWIASMGLWEDELPLLHDLYGNCETKLWQVSAILEILSQKERSCVCTQALFPQNQLARRKDISYGIFHVFHENFLGLLRPYIGRQLQRSTYDSIRKQLLLKFFSVWTFMYYTDHGNYTWSAEESLILSTFRAYRREKYYPSFVLSVARGILSRKCKAALRKVPGLRRLKQAIQKS